MDSGLARFAVLIVLFFMLTGDLAGIVRQLYEESSGYGGGKQQQQQQQQTTVSSNGNGPRVVMSDKGSMAMTGGSSSASTSAPESASAQGEGSDADIEAYGEQSLLL